MQARSGWSGWRGLVTLGLMTPWLGGCGGDDVAGTDAADEVGSESGGSSESGSESSDANSDSSDSSSEASTESTTDTVDTSDTTESTETGPEPIDPRHEALLTYAPRVWLDVAEEYFPSSVEFAFPSLVRYVESDGQYWLRTVQPLDSASDDSPPFFQGELATAPVYAYWADKGGGVIDLVYFFYYPYNRGKSVVDTIWGNHVGDWEHITVRVMQQPDATLIPDQVYLSAHSFGGAYPWADVEKVEATHPVVYSAWGSHGVWKDPGDHVYQSIGFHDPIFDTCISLVCADLTDVTSQGTAWDTWQLLEGFDYFAQEGLGDSEWPVWMSDQFMDPGAGNPAVPGMGPIFRWGNPEDCSTLGVDISDLIGVCRLEDGPTGPISKSTWGPGLE